ncbi:hypothetical protein LCGC14_1705590 [marine sediment metagenome]|uniref:Uncharacterized protein n=1 Tax=marine sediment metagenome TaxID=412755 RepID=A0A0F9JX45_9ZZZZ
MTIKYDWNNLGGLKSFVKVDSLMEIVVWLEQKIKDNWYYNENRDYTSRITQVHIILEPLSDLWIILHPTIDAYYLMAADSRIAIFMDKGSVLAYLRFFKGG